MVLCVSMCVYVCKCACKYINVCNKSVFAVLLMQSVFLVFTCMYPQGFMQDNVFASDSHFQSIADDMYDL